MTQLPPWTLPFFEALKSTGVVARACRQSGAPYGSVSKLRKENAEFAASFDDAMEEAVDKAEAEAWRRGVRGYEEPVVYQGQLTPVFELDERGAPILDLVEALGGDGKPFTRAVPRQAKNEDGTFKYLTVRKHSDALLALVLKARRKEFSTERTELTGAAGGPVAMDDTTRAARIAALMALAKGRASEEDFSDLA